MATPLGKLDTRSDTIARTHDSLYAHWLAYVQEKRFQITLEMCEHDKGQIDRCREIILMGMRLCDTKMGTTAEINEVVDIRLQEIDRETRPFWPDPFGSRLTQASDTPEAPTGQGVESVEDDVGSGDTSLPLYHQPSSLIGDNDEEWEDDLYHSDEEDDPSPSHGLPFRARPLSDARNPWSITQTKLVETLKQVDNFYAESGAKKDLFYTKTLDLLQAAMNCTYRRPPWMDPVKLWLDTERAYLALTEHNGDDSEEIIEEVIAAARIETGDTGNTGPGNPTTLSHSRAKAQKHDHFVYDQVTGVS
jgi:hypothetical protein